MSYGSNRIATIAPTGVNVSLPNTTVSSGYLAYTPNDATAAAAITLVQSGTPSAAIGQAINDAYNAISAAPTQEAILATNAAATAAASAADELALLAANASNAQSQAPGAPDSPGLLVLMNGSPTANGSSSGMKFDPNAVLDGSQVTIASGMKFDPNILLDTSQVQDARNINPILLMPQTKFQKTVESFLKVAPSSFGFCLGAGATGLGGALDGSVCTFGGKVSGVAFNGASGVGIVVGEVPVVAYETGSAFSTNAKKRSDLDGNSVCGMAAAATGILKYGPMVCLSLKGDYANRSIGSDIFTGLYTVTAGIGPSTPNLGIASSLEFGYTKTLSFPKPAGILTGIPPRF